MYVRKLPNRSGSTSVQIICKADGKYRVVKTVGTSRDPDEIERLFQKAKHIVNQPDPNQYLFFDMHTPTDQVVKELFESLTNAQIRTIGPELIYGTLFDRMGFNQIPEELFRHLVIARLAYPVSKLKTIDYLYRYQGVSYSVSTIYKFLDRLHSRYKQQVEQIAYHHTEKRLGTVSVVFYDMTTLYFEAEEEDDLRKIGFSKDGKFQHPQIMIGLLVGEEGLPIGYDLFEGNTFEGHTLLPMLEAIQKKYGLKQPIVIADAAMLSRSNLTNLAEAKYSFIIGARIKNENNQIKQEILQKVNAIKNEKAQIFERGDGTRLVVTWSKKRAQKDERNRNKGIQRLEKRVKSGRLTKESINNRGYNKFLRLEGEINVCIDEAKIKADQDWDGLKGYLTNTQLNASQIVENYSHLWQIEKAFRISKTDLRIRPVHHYRKRRIKAHLCISFVAYSIYKELELLLKKKNLNLSPSSASTLTHTMYQMCYRLPDSEEEHNTILKMDEDQQALYNVVHKP